MSSQTVEFEEITDDRYGGKAAGLARLRRLGLPVPPGYVIAGASGVSDSATARFDEMAAAGWTPVAVRSSAVGEDGDDQSFAGQYDTVLGVDTVDRFVDAVRACADSVHSRSASSYSGNASATMNVVVQRMVDARAAGVVFTADPVSGRRDLTVIDVVSGLGESLVDGTVAPDHVVLDADGTAVVNETVAAPVLSPVEIAGTPSRSQIRAAWVPLPAPGGPMINMRVMFSPCVNVRFSPTLPGGGPACRGRARAQVRSRPS